jgi:hypothetical protein
MDMVESAINDFQELVDAGDGDNDISGLIRLKRLPDRREETVDPGNPEPGHDDA